MPCRCSGSCKYIHKRCLEDWQNVQRGQGHWQRAKRCEICHAPYKLAPGAPPGSAKWLKQLASGLSRQLLAVLNCASWPVLLYRVWKLYAIGSSVVTAVRAGAVGLQAGFRMGRGLVEEQTGMLLQLLAAMSGVLGTPYAELIWCQAVACLAFALLSEMVYTSLLGGVFGVCFGFVRGYVQALRSTAGLATTSAAKVAGLGRGLLKLAGWGLRSPGGALRAALAAAVRHLPARVL